MSDVKMGGQPLLRVLLTGGDDVVNSLLSIEDGGHKLGRGFRELVREKYNGTFDVEVRREDWGRGLPSVNGDGLPVASPADVMVISILADVSGMGEVQDLKERLSRIIRAVKESSDAHIIVYNCSSVDPTDDVHNYHGRPDTFSVRVHRFNLALMQLSAEEGISIIDVERIVGQLAGERHVGEPMRYSEETYGSIGEEFLRVLEDIGFFEKRPLVLQIGQRRN